MLKSWADENDILFGEGNMNLNWTIIMNTIKDDPHKFVSEGCWNFITDIDDEEEEEEEERENDDPEYEEEEIESSEDEYEDAEEEIESEGEDEGDDALSEEGKSWDSMENDAKKADNEHAKKMKEKENFKKANKNKRKK